MIHPHSRCFHMNFRADVKVARIEDTGLKYADITIRCVDCGSPAVFRGMPTGLSPDQPCGSVDAQEARLPFLCEGDTYDGTSMGFTITGKLS